MKGPFDQKQSAIHSIKNFRQFKEGERKSLFIPENMIPVYCLSRISKNFLNTYSERFQYPPQIVPNNVDFCRVIIDKEISATKLPTRVTVNKVSTGDEDYFVVWNGKEADIVHRKKLNKNWKILGSILI